jgi:hypothetical protein
MVMKTLEASRRRRRTGIGQDLDERSESIPRDVLWLVKYSPEPLSA